MIPPSGAPVRLIPNLPLCKTCARRAARSRDWLHGEGRAQVESAIRGAYLVAPVPDWDRATYGIVSIARGDHPHARS